MCWSPFDIVFTFSESQNTVDCFFPYCPNILILQLNRGVFVMMMHPWALNLFDCLQISITIFRNLFLLSRLIYWDGEQLQCNFYIEIDECWLPTEECVSYCETLNHIALLPLVKQRTYSAIRVFDSFFVFSSFARPKFLCLAQSYEGFIIHQDSVELKARD